MISSDMFVIDLYITYIQRISSLDIYTQLCVHATLGSKTDARQLYVDVVVHVIFRERLVCECVAAVAARVVDVGDGRAGATRGQHQHNGGEPRSLVAPTRKALLHHARSGEKTYFKVK